MHLGVMLIIKASLDASCLAVLLLLQLLQCGSLLIEVFNPHIAIRGVVYPPDGFLPCCSEIAANCEESFCDFSGICVG